MQLLKLSVSLTFKVTTGKAAVIQSDSVINLPTGDQCGRFPVALACIWCVSTLSGIKKKVGVDCGGGRDRKKREGRRGQGEKEK